MALADSQRRSLGRGLGGLDSIWALGVLAAAFPDQALWRIDYGLRRVEWDRRQQATEAAGRLPDDLAWPRLLAAAADGVPAIAQRAQQIWLERRGCPCPLDEIAGLETTVLDRAPSDRMLSRLVVMRRGPLQARAAMVEVLFGEAPDPEALVLLLFAAIDSSLWERRPRAGLPQSREDYCAALVDRFGARAAEGLCALATRYPEGRWGWFHQLAQLLNKGSIPQTTFAALQAAAARRIAQPPHVAEEHAHAVRGIATREALAILGTVGTPAELADQVWSLALDPAEDHFVRSAAVDALRALPAGEADREGARLAELEAALDLAFSHIAVGRGWHESPSPEAYWEDTA